MLTRRELLGALGAGWIATSPLWATEEKPAKRKRLAVVTTEWRYHSHAWHMAERFLVGYPIEGRWRTPAFEVVSAYIDQTPKNDLSRDRAKEFGFKIYPTIAETLRQGGKDLAVDGVLIIGEHGEYPKNKLGQTPYPRYEFFKQVVDVFRKDGRVVPIFNDKHLSWKWEWAQEMVKVAKEMGIPFIAGSSLPVTWRMPSIDLPIGCDVEELMCVAMGAVDSYDFHALEVIQCMAERRRGGETGVAAIEALRGPVVWDSAGLNSELFQACLSRSHTLAQTPTGSHRYPTDAQMREWVKEPIAYRIEYSDGVRATMLLMNGLVGDFTFAAKLKGKAEPTSTLFYLPPNPNVVYSAALMSKVEETFTTGKAPYPIERTLLTTGLVAAGCQSLADGKRLETPQLAVRYSPNPESTFWTR